MITQELLHEQFIYRGDGHLMWRVRKQGRRLGVPAGSVKPDGYRRIMVDGEVDYAHRLVFMYWHGHMPAEIDHRNHRRDDNRITNLRAVTRQQNHFNRSGVVGACYEPKRDKWKAAICVDGRYIQIGRFATEAEARAAYIEAKAKLHTINGPTETAA